MRKNAGICLILFLLAPVGATAHHSRATFFDMNQIVELEGEITRVQWRHPHVRYWLQADPAYGGAEWEMESTPPSLLERQGIGPDISHGGNQGARGRPAIEVFGQYHGSQPRAPAGWTRGAAAYRP